MNKNITYKEWLGPRFANRFDADNNYIDGLREGDLEYILKILYPNNTFVHNKFLKYPDGTYVTDFWYRKIKPDYVCEELKIIVEFDGESNQRKGHYSDAITCLKDENHTEIFEALGYKVIRIPFYIQLDRCTISYYFNIDYDGEPLHKMYFDHGFLHSNICFPSNFCQLGMERFVKELKSLPLNLSHEIIFTLVIRMNYFKQIYDGIGDLNKYPEELKVKLGEHSFTNHIFVVFPDFIMKDIMEITNDENCYKTGYSFPWN